MKRAEKPAPKARAQRFEYWKNETNKLWYWHLRAVNNKIIAQCYEGSRRKRKMLLTIESLQIGSVSASVVELTKPQGGIDDYSQHTPVPAGKPAAARKRSTHKRAKL